MWQKGFGSSTESGSALLDKIISELAEGRQGQSRMEDNLFTSSKTKGGRSVLERK